jgi:hypothetical protein
VTVDLVDPPTVRREVARGVWVDWTHLAIEADGEAKGHGTEDTEAVEQLARREVDIAIRQAADRVRLTQDLTVEGIEGDDRVWDAVASRLPRWEVDQGTYYTSGKVELKASLSLQELLKPWTLSVARPAPAQPESPPAWTGIVLDARGTGVEPCWAPALATAEGKEILSIRMWDEDAVNTAPLVWVSDPAHPAAARAGVHPVFVRVASASGTTLVLGGDDLSRLEAILGDVATSRFLGEGKVVVVVDP